MGPLSTAGGHPAFLDARNRVASPCQYERDPRWSALFLKAPAEPPNANTVCLPWRQVNEVPIGLLTRASDAT